MDTVNGNLRIIRTSDNQTTILLDGEKGNINLGGGGSDGDIIIHNSNGNITIGLNGNSGNILLGGEGTRGTVIVKNGLAKDTVIINSGGEELDDQDPGYTPPGATIELKNYNGDSNVFLDGGLAEFKLGSSDLAGRLSIGRPGNDEPKITMTGSTGGIFIKQSANGGITLANSDGERTIQIDGQNGDIIFENADLAEEFEVVQDQYNLVKPGMIMVLDSNGKIAPCKSSYDSKIAGVVAGAGKFKPALVLDKRLGEKNRVPLSMLGKVSCYADASHGEIQIGDLLTSSPLLGHAMKAEKSAQSIGCILGKALSPLEKGSGLINMLILHC